tara:strand:+ start:564 stop:992 length:429 start_codon:yes stop_codon:yes gene_type:complete
MLEKIINNEEECELLGIAIANKLNQGDVVSLEGDLGSGKTTFVKGILKGLNYKYDVTSPTFTLINEYNADLKVIHIDFYRENDTQRWKEIGINEYFHSNNLVLIEWGNMIDEILPDNVIRIYFEHITLNKRKVYSNYESFGH